MTDSNTYNEMMRMGRGSKTDAFSSTDAEDSAVKRMTDNIAAAAETSPEEVERRYRAAIEYMNRPETQDFYRRLRRHESNPFNALFYDKEPLTEQDVSQRVARAAAFFDLPIPAMIDQCETLAKITYSDVTDLGSEIQYDIQKLSEIGINNVDAFDAMLSHELSHQFVANRRFNFCKNKQWCVELACDYIVGVRCSAQVIASGKYKFAVSTMKTSETHPDGRFRVDAVKSGFDFAEWLFRRGQMPTAESAMIGLTQWLITHSKALNESYHEFLTTPTPAPQRPRDITELPDSNLIKQKVLQIRAAKAAKAKAAAQAKQNKKKKKKNATAKLI